MSTIVQILAPDPQRLIALCSDGTLWRLDKGGEWSEIPLPPPIEAARRGRFAAKVEPRRRRPAP